MLRFIPDWIIYGLALAVVLWTIFSGSPEQNAPPPPPEAIEREGAMLPPPSAFDQRILVQVTRPKDGIGTAFAINDQGDWLTARHVVEGCASVALLVAPNQYVEADSIIWSESSDLAVVQTGYSPSPVTLDTSQDMRIGDYGFHIGYPQGRPGEAASRLLSRSNLVSQGVRQGTEPVLAWAETGRTRGLNGSLGGLSGGPVFSAEGTVRGVVIAESPRKGRIYTAAPEAIDRFLNEVNVERVGDRQREFTPTTYGSEADTARRRLQVVKLACDVSEGA